MLGDAWELPNKGANMTRANYDDVNPVQKPKIPTAKSVVEGAKALADWYRQFRPDVQRIAVTPMQMHRIAKMIEANKGQGFTRQRNGVVYFETFRVHVVSDPNEGMQ